MEDEPGTGAAGGVEPGEGAGSAGAAEEGRPDYEARAKEKGWKPKDAYEGDKESWVDAEEFVKREPLFDKIRNQSKEIKEMKRTVEAMATHFQKATKAAVDNAVAALKAQRKEQIELGNVDAVEKIDEQIELQKSVAAENKQNVPAVPVEIASWVEQNQWFTEDQERRDFAIAYNESYLKSHPGDLEKSLVETTKAVKRAFPEKFENKRREDPPAVEGGSAPKGGGSKYTLDRLSPEQKLVYKQVVSQHKVMGHDEYFKSLEEIGELK